MSTTPTTILLLVTASTPYPATSIGPLSLLFLIHNVLSSCAFCGFYGSSYLVWGQCAVIHEFIIAQIWIIFVIWLALMLL